MLEVEAADSAMHRAGSWISCPMMDVSGTLILIPKDICHLSYKSGLFKKGKAKHLLLKVTVFFLLHSDSPYSYVFY